MRNWSRLDYGLTGIIILLALVGVIWIGLAVLDWDDDPTDEAGELPEGGYSDEDPYHEPEQDSITDNGQDLKEENGAKPIEPSDSNGYGDIKWIPDPPSIASISLPTYEPPDSDSLPGLSTAESQPFAGFDDAGGAGLHYETVDGGAIIPHRHGSFVTDINNNGYEDVLLIGGEQPVLFENSGGSFEQRVEFDPFESIPPTVAHFLDYNNNGYEDLLFFAPNREPALYKNRAGNFTPVSGIFNTTVRDPRTVSSADFTGNGCLDFYVGSWFESTDREFIEDILQVAKGHPDIRPDIEGSPNTLYVGDCEVFKDVTETAGVEGNGHTFGTSAADFTGNGYIDIHVANDFMTDYLYENQGDGTFEPIDMGLDSDRNAMSSAVMDLTGNHLLDIFVTNVYFEDPPAPETLVPVTRAALPVGNNLFANLGEGEFVDIAPEHGLNRGGWGWATTIADFTNDGHLDIIHATSYVNPDILPQQPEIFAPPQVWNGTGTSWTKVDGWDIGFQEHKMRGLTRIDHNANGALDIVAVGNPSRRGVTGTNQGVNRTILYENTLESNEFLQLWIRKPDGIERNAGVYIQTDTRTIYRETNSRGDFSSQDSRLIHVGLANETIESVIVEWPDGHTTAYDQLDSGIRYIITPNGAEPVS